MSNVLLCPDSPGCQQADRDPNHQRSQQQDRARKLQSHEQDFSLNGLRILKDHDHNQKCQNNQTDDFDGAVDFSK